MMKSKPFSSQTGIWFLFSFKKRGVVIVVLVRNLYKVAQVLRIIIQNFR